jgi:CHAT domain-containing protein
MQHLLKFTARHRQWMIVLGAALFATACQSTVTIEEAKKISTSFNDAAFVPPPRSITDITAILDEQELVDPEKTKEKVAKADAQAPDSGNKTTLLRFYLKRGLAARAIGRDVQALEDLRKAFRNLKGARIGGRERIRLLQNLAGVEGNSGNPRNAIRYMKSAIGKRPTPTAYRQLVEFYARAGDLTAAETAWNDGKTLISRSRERKNISPKQLHQLSIEADRLDHNLYESRGQWKKAETALRGAIETRKVGSFGSEDASWMPSRQKQLASILMKQGRLVEAEIMARGALLDALANIGRNNSTTADVVRILATILHRQGRFDAAETLSRTGIDIQTKAGMSPSSRKIAQGRRFLATVLVSKENWQGALEVVERARTDLIEHKKLFNRMFERNPSVPLALLRTGQPEEAVTLLFDAHQRIKNKLGEKHGKTANWGMLLAMARAETGDRASALAGFRKAIPIVLSRSRQSDDEDSDVAAADQQLAMVLESYIGLLADIRGSDLERQTGIDAAAEAFRIADLARGRSVQSAVAASGARSAADSPELAELVRSEQDTAKQTATLFALLADVLASPTDQQDADAVETLRGKIDQLRGARAVMMEEIEARFPEYAELINPKPATIDQARAILRPGEALIATYVGVKQTYIWAVPREGAVAFAKADEGREDLEDTVALLRSSLEPNAQTLGDIPDFDVDVAYGLYASLFKPVEAGWKKANSLLIVAHGPLGYLPPSLLPTAPLTKVAMAKGDGALFSNHRNVAWLAKSHAVTLLPSVASLKTLRSLPPGDDKRKSFAGFGDPFFNAQQAMAKPVKAEQVALTSRGLTTRGLPVRLRAAPKTASMDSAELGLLPRLPDTSDEVRSIAIAMNADLTQDVFLGKQANEGTVKSMDLSGYKVLAFATHGLVPGDLNGLTQPALALSAPGVAGTSGDGLLTMGEILSLKLDADWVVLSACNTGTGNGAGAEAVSGLGRAFFYAGTRALLVSNWPVETTSAKALTTDLFRRQAEDASLTRSEAHRRAMLALIEEGGYVDSASGKTVFSYAHPIFWAPFTLIGDGGGGQPKA